MRMPFRSRAGLAVSMAVVVLALLIVAAAGSAAPRLPEMRQEHLRALAGVDSLIAAARYGAAEQQARLLLGRPHLDDDVHWQAEQRLGLALHRQGRLDEALDHMEKAALWAPMVSVNHQNLAALLIDMGRTGRALGEWREAVELDPQNWRLNLDYAQVLVDFGQYDRAERYLEAAEMIAPDRIEVVRGWARLHLERGEPAAALPYLETLYAEEPDIETRRLLAEARLAAGRSGDVRDLLAPHWESLDGTEMALVLRADHQQGDATRAASLVMGLKDGRPAPLPADIWALASALCADAAHKEDGLLLIRQAVLLDPDNALYRNNMVSLLYALGRDEEAEREWRIVIRLDPSLAGNRTEISE